MGQRQPDRYEAVGGGEGNKKSASSVWRKTLGKKSTQKINHLKRGACSTSSKQKNKIQERQPP